MLDCAALGLTPPAPLTTIRQYAPPPPRGTCTMIESDDPSAAGRELIRRLHEEAKII